MRLLNWQYEFAEAITLQETTPPFVIPTGHLEIYRRNYHATHHLALSDCYPMVRKLIGDDCFHALTTQYLMDYPSCSSNIHEYGAHFDHFLENHPHLETHRYLRDVARFEWSVHRLAFCADAPTFPVAILDQITPANYDHLFLILHPASDLLACDIPLLDIIDLCEGKITSMIDLLPKKTWLLLIRREKRVTILALTADEFSFLTALKDNQPITVAIEKALAMNALFDLTHKLSGWIQNQVIVDMSVTYLG